MASRRTTNTSNVARRFTKQLEALTQQYNHEIYNLPPETRLVKSGRLDRAERGTSTGAMDLVCLDLEGVLLPEFWIAVAEATGIDELRRTTRDEPDYDVLMRYRLDILERHDLTLPAIHDAIRDLEPLEGAREFTEWLTSTTRLIILSDTFVQFAAPLMARLGNPTMFCHELEIDDAGRIRDYRLRQPDQKRRAVEALQGLNFRVIAAGDSWNDLTMLQSADHGILFRPAESMLKAHPEFPVARTHAELRVEIERLLAI